MSEVGISGADAVRAAVVKDTAISVVINTVISIGFFLALFGLARPAQSASFGADFLIQAFMVTLMGTGVPCLLLRKRTGEPVRKIVTRSVLMAVAASLIAGGGAYAICRAIGNVSIPPATGLLVKALFGAALSVFVTPPAVRAALAHARRD